MKQWAGLGLAQRLYITSALLVTGMAALAVTVWMLMSTVITDAETIERDRAPQLQRISELELNVTRASLQLRHAILARTPQERSTALDDVAAKKQILDTTLEAFGKAMVDEDGRKAFAALPGLMKTFWDVGGENVKLIQADKRDEAFAFLADKTVPARNLLLAPLGIERTRQQKLLDHDLIEVASEAATGRKVVLAAVLMLGFGLLGFAAYVIHVMRSLGGEPADLKRAADAVAAGNLAVEIPVRAGDTDSVMAALKAMSQQLSRTVKSVQENAGSVAVASAEIASGNLDLSSRTEQQASALEQTAASMEQLGTTVKQNADNARQANELAKTSSSVAIQGGTVVREVVSTMREINDSSKKISDIIAVIDGIAFQTNILALNAAVEAARAGEQGRGFAVVASEVRSLAQRSAEAAREIKTLIGASVERVEKGTALVDQAGTTMQEIVASIQRVSDIVAQISSASVEQSLGVQQVSEAVTSMDRTTQQNAALVEESAAAAESLKAQSQQLMQAMGAFRLA